MMYVCAKSLQSIPTIFHSMDWSPPGSSVHGIAQERLLERVALPSSRGSSPSRDRTHVLHLLHWQMGSLPLLPPGKPFSMIVFVQTHSCLTATPWTAACQASPSITNSRSLPKLVSIESVMPSNHFILCHPLLFLPSIFPSIRVFSDE